MFAKFATLTILALLASVSGATTVFAASTAITVALCPANDSPADFLYKQDYFAADGTVGSLLLTAEPTSGSACRSTTVQIDGDILWAGLASADHVESNVDQVGLQGIFNAEPYVVSEILAIAETPAQPPQSDQNLQSTPPVEPLPLPLNESVSHHFVPRLFGLEERATAPEQNHLACTPGSHIAGAFFHSQRAWPAGNNLQLEIRARGHGRFEIAAGNSELDVTQLPISLGEMELSEQLSTLYRFDLPDSRLPWTSLTVVCPEGAGRLVMSSMLVRSTTSDSPPDSAPPSNVEEQLSPSARAIHRGAWLWSPELWLRESGFIWQTQTQEQLSEVYISVTVDETGGIANSAELAQFIREASSRSLRVWVVMGDPHDVLPDNQTAVESRINALLTYNNEASESARLAGVQLDIEPYLLSGFSQAQHHWRERYVAVIQRVHQMLNGQMTVDLVMPAWWGYHSAWGELLLSQMPVSDTRISIMNYHTSPEQLRLNAEPFLNWGQRSGVPIQVGVESGYLRDESQRRYRAHADTGELWLLPVGEQSIFLLLDQPQSNLQGKPFAYAFEYAVPASLYTFAGDMARLNAVIAELEPEWRDWSSFSGISIHGLDDANQREGAR